MPEGRAGKREEAAPGKTEKSRATSQALRRRQRREEEAVVRGKAEKKPNLLADGLVKVEH